MRTSRLVLLLVPAIAISGWAPPVTADDAVSGSQLAEATEGSETIDDEAMDEEAVRFRQTFGFQSDLDFVRAARLDKAAFSSEPYGVPLSLAEIADLQDRAQVQLAMDGAVAKARMSSSFAGAYIDQLAGGQPVFMFTADDPEAERLVAYELPVGTSYRLEEAARTEKDLLTLKERLEFDLANLEKDGIEVVRIGFRASRNTLFIGVHGLTEAGQKSLTDRYGPGLVMFEDDVAHSDVCSGTNNCRPIKGGISINSGGGAAGECTSGFVVHRYDNGNLLLLTAGHCIQVHGGYDQVWEHNNNSFGRARYETWKPGGTGPSDVGLMTLFSGEEAQMTNKNQIRRSNGSVTAVTTITIGPNEGSQACRVGRASGHDCGVVLEFPASRKSKVAGFAAMTVTETATVNFDSIAGDSGGPVFFYIGGGTSGSAVSALGTHVHSEDGPNANEGWFSPIYTGVWDYEAKFGYSYRPCLSASCPNG